MIQLLERRVIDIVGLSKLKVILNDKDIKQNNFESYLNLFQSDQVLYFGSCIKNNMWEYALRFNDLRNIDSGIHISFINGIYTNS